MLVALTIEKATVAAAELTFQLYLASSVFNMVNDIVIESSCSLIDAVF